MQVKTRGWAPVGCVAVGPAVVVTDHTANRVIVITYG